MSRAGVCSRAVVNDPGDPNFDRGHRGRCGRRTNVLLIQSDQILDVIFDRCSCFGRGLRRRLRNQWKNQPVAFEFVSEMHP